MKFKIFFLSVFAVFGIHARDVSFNTPDLGKTHFIVGLPPEKITTHVAVIPPCVGSTDLISRLRCSDGSMKQAFFSPDDDVQGLLIDLIKNEQKSIKAAVFSFTDGDVAQALLDARKRNVAVEIVTDVSAARDKFNKIELLQKNKIPVYVYNPKAITVLNNIMHNKFVLFEQNVNGKSLLWTGSFNFTKSAHKQNQENVIVLDERHLIERYDKQFAVLKERAGKKSSVKLAQGKKKRREILI